MVSTLEQMQVPNRTGPGVRRSKRPLLASRTRCNVLWEPRKFGNKVKIGNKFQFGNKFANWCNVCLASHRNTEPAKKNLAHQLNTRSAQGSSGGRVVKLLAFRDWLSPASKSRYG